MNQELTNAKDATPVRVSVQGAVAEVLIDSPKTRNALSMEVMEALIRAFTELGERTDVHSIILKATGHVFSSGHDLREIRGAGEGAQRETFGRCAELMLLIQSIPQPVIAQVQGVATAAGCQLVATCDLAVAVDSAKFATPGVAIGLFCSTPMVALSRAVPRKVALRMLLTGEMIGAEEALTHGLVSHVASADELEETTRKLAQAVALASSATVAVGKKAFYQQIEMTTEEAYEAMAKTMAANAMSCDAQEGIDAFLSKRAPVWKGRG